MKKYIASIVISFLSMSGVAAAQTLATTTPAATIQTSRGIGDEVSQANKQAEQQIRVLRQEMEAKIKAIRQEYQAKIEALRKAAQSKIQGIKDTRKKTEEEMRHKRQDEMKKKQEEMKQKHLQMKEDMKNKTSSSSTSGTQQ